MSFQYPEIKVEGSGKSENGWDSQCASYELLADDIKYGKNKPQQSPININTKTIQECSTMCNLEINYKPGKCRIDKYESNLIRLIHDEGSFIKFGENNYELKFVFFHTPGNHLIDGKSSYMEINLYHGIMEDIDVTRVEEARRIKIKNKHNHKHFHAHTDGLEDNNLNNRKNGVVLSILVDIDKTEETRASKPNIFFSQFMHTDALRDLKQKEDPVIIDVGKKWSIENILPEKRSFYTYTGSIAMPPCTENYSWVVFDKHITIISEYLKIFREIGNPKSNRPVHPLNGRLVFFNPNVKISEKKPEDIDKNTFIERQLAPIRIMYDNRAGSEYRARADYVISKYSGGPNTGYLESEGKLKNIVNDWEETSKIGYRDVMVDDMFLGDTTVTSLSDIANLGDTDKERVYNLLDNIVFDYYIYNDFNYLKYYIDITPSITDLATLAKDITPTSRKIMSLLNRDGSFFKNIYQYPSSPNPSFLETIGTIVNNLNPNHKTNIKNFLAEVMKDTTITDDELETLFSIFSPTPTPTPTPTLSDIDKVLLYLLISWDKHTFPDITDLMDIFVRQNNNTKLQNLRRELIFELLKKFKNDNTKYLVFKEKNEELTQTIDGYTCQEWGSNKVHYEGDIFEFWKKPLSIPKEGVLFNNMTPELKEAAKDGLMVFKEGKFKRHNSCRNPNNSEGAPWCYTDNAKVRWQYCAIPDNVPRNKYYVLFFIFIMIIVLSLFLVKLISKYEILSKIVSSITGGNLTSQSVGDTMGTPTPGLK